MIAYVGGQQNYTRNLGYGFTKGNAERGRANRTYDKKSVKCINTGKIFNSLEDAIKWCGLKSITGISNVCANRYKYSGRHPETGEPLIWEYV